MIKQLSDVTIVSTRGEGFGNFRTQFKEQSGFLPRSPERFYSMCHAVMG